ncbi:UdgX family uracil-DNA binding protein [Acidiphilium acidophilum]|uniref:UdgX family uracil-DNA binding protein n=1 Tax=Acidiphilium acidophilum TaxID=76588 RepID=UPI002E8E6732|nr:UdgX family uracil-DNA binding protein [Acidiphilium acidophilum]
MTTRVTLTAGADRDGFRQAVRRLLAVETPPDDVIWNASGGLDLFGTEAAGDAPPVMLPRAVTDLVGTVVCHRDPERYALLYRLIWRIRHGEAGLLANPADRLVHRLEAMRKAIGRDLHKMHAFVRFRETVAPDGIARYIAWFEPDHYIVEATAGFFIERFRSMIWAILTPVGSLFWDTERLVVGGPGDKAQLPADDEFEAGWCSYYASIFNPARLNPTMMRSEMAMKYWRNLPEAALIPHLIRDAPERVRTMVDHTAEAPRHRDPTRAVAAMERQNPADLAALNRIIADAQPMVTGGTRAVLGEGPTGAAIALVGEQPGDAEDLAGRPFVGPAGQMLDRALAEAGLDRAHLYVTNAVKHFKYEQRGKRRMHATPSAGEVKHYRWWLMQEIGFVNPKLVVALGATALHALSGKALPLLRNRGPMELDGRAGFVTVHPSYLLRLPDEASRQAAYQAFVADLRQIRDSVGLNPPP